MDHSLWTVGDGPRNLAFLAREEEAEPGRPVEHAFTRCGFSEEEWWLLHDSPLRAFLWVATVDGPVSPREREACRRVLEVGQFSLSPLVGRLHGEALWRLDALGAERLGEPPDVEALRPLCQRVAERLGLGEAERFRRGLLAVGWRVARASSGLWGRMGWVRREERLALTVLEETLEPWSAGG